MVNNKTKHVCSLLSKTWPWLVLALLFRLPGLNQSLWLDEAIQALSSRLSLPQLLILYMPGDFNPPLSHILTWMIVRLIGMSEISLRLPSLLAGIGVVWLSRRLLRLLIPKNQLLFNAGTLLVATAPLLLYYSQEARPYELAALFVIWSLTSFYEYIFLGAGRKWEYCLVTAILFFTHYVAWFIYPIEILLAFILNSPRSMREKITALTLPLVGIVLVLPVLIPQLLVGIGVADTLSVWRSLSAFSLRQLALIPAKILAGRLPLEPTPLYILALGLPLLLWFIVWMWSSDIFLRQSIKNYVKTHTDWLFLTSWLVIPVVIGIIVSLKVAIFTYFRFLFIVPAFYLLLVYGLQKLPKRFGYICLAFFIVINCVASGLYVFNLTYHREDWRGLVTFLNENADTNTVMIISAVDAPLRYYDKGHHIIKDYSEVDTVKYDGALWLITYAQPIFEPDNHTQRQLEGLGFTQVSEKHFRGDLIVKYYVNKSKLTT